MSWIDDLLMAAAVVVVCREQGLKEASKTQGCRVCFGGRGERRGKERGGENRGRGGRKGGAFLLFLDHLHKIFWPRNTIMLAIETFPRLSSPPAPRIRLSCKLTPLHTPLSKHGTGRGRKDSTRRSNRWGELFWVRSKFESEEEEEEEKEDCNSYSLFGTK